MFCFFAHSYRQWESTSSIHLTEDEILANLQLGPWLNDTKLFKEAWGTALETPARFWWTQQIFFFTSIWSVFLGQQGTALPYFRARKGNETNHDLGFARHIPHLWAYMLLGQVVAISFATNLFFLGTSLSPVSSSTSLRIQERWTLSTATLLIPLLATFISTGLIPSSVTKPYFMYLLLLPHVALFIPPILYSVPQSWGTIHPSAEAAQRFYERVYSLLVMLSIVLICLASNVTWNSIEGALYEHPAVSSVGWDVILCWISWGTWIFVHQVDRSDDRKARQGKQR
jgi:hypothetical protein